MCIQSISLIEIRILSIIDGKGGKVWGVFVCVIGGGGRGRGWGGGGWGWGGGRD